MRYLYATFIKANSRRLDNICQGVCAWMSWGPEKPLQKPVKVSQGFSRDSKMFDMPEPCNIFQEELYTRKGTSPRQAHIL